MEAYPTGSRAYLSDRDNQKVLVEMWTVDALDGDYAAAVLFSQLLWWFQTPKGKQRPRVSFAKQGHLWLVRADDDWQRDCRLTQKQVRRIRRVLLERGLIIYSRFQFHGAPTSAWRPDFDAIAALDNCDDCLAQMGESEAGSVEMGETNAEKGETSRPLRANPISTALVDTTNSTKNLPVVASDERGPTTSQRAHAITKAWWTERVDAGNPPAQKFVAAAKVVAGVLGNGVNEAEVAWALRNCPVVSAGAIEMTLSRRRGNGVSPALAKEQRTLDAMRARAAKGNPPLLSDESFLSIGDGA